MTVRLNGKEVAETIKAEIAGQCAEFKAETGVVPTLAVILVGRNPASVSYVTGKKTAALEVGFDCKDIELKEETSEEELLALVEELNNDDTVHGILVQMPLPSQINSDHVIEAIRAEKDVDGLTSYNAGLLMTGKETLAPCTPLGVLAILDYYHIPTEGKNVVVIGRSRLVGLPLAVMLMGKNRNATVTVCNSRTPDLKKETLKADILISAVGKPGTVTSDMVKDGAVVIDVGVTRVSDPTRERGWRLSGDVDYAAVKEVASAITPVPGGVGPMTITMLMRNTLLAARLYGKRK